MRESDTKNRGSRRSPELYDRLGKGQYERKKNSRGTKAWPCGNLHGALAMDRERDSLVFFRCHNKATRVSSSTAPPPSDVPTTTLQPRGLHSRFKKRSALRCLMQRAAMTIAAHCVGTCTALRFSGQRFSSVRRADPMVQLAPGHQPYNPAHASCISCFIGARSTTDVSAHSSPLSKESSPIR